LPIHGIRITAKVNLSLDLRFPISLDQSGLDAINPAGDYSAAYIILRTPREELNGHGFSFTIRRGNNLVCAAARYTAERLVGKGLAELTKDMGKTWRYLVSDSQLRWVGPEK
jgi:L-galactonate dehydratase